MQKGAARQPNTGGDIASQLANTHPCVGGSPRRGAFYTIINKYPIHPGFIKVAGR